MPSPPAKEVEWEVLPPEEKQRRREVEPLFKWIALIMDDLLRLPGTNFRIGLDPIIGLIPGIGDTSSALVSAAVLIQAVRRGLPKILIARMSVNILINEIVGIVPIAGDAFSFWFKSNSRNYDLLKKHQGASSGSRKSDWLFVIVVLCTLAFIVVAGIAVTFFLLSQAAKMISGQ
jgi:hypothetical protein